MGNICKFIPYYVARQLFIYVKLKIDTSIR